MDLAVQGEIPPELDGSYVRNGPNAQFPRPDGWQYPYDGDGMLHVVTFAQVRGPLPQPLGPDRATSSPSARSAARSTPAPSTPATWRPDDRTATARREELVEHERRLARRQAPLALGGRRALRAQRGAFGTVGEHTFDGALPGAMTAHPKIDPIWDELCFFRYSAEPPYLVYGVVSPRGEISRTVPIDIPRPVLMHDFAVTDQHVVFFDSPAVIDPAAAATGAPMVRWEPEHGTRIGVMSRDGEHDHVRWFPVENRFAMHFMNAYNDGDAIVVDYVHRPSFELDTAVGIEQTPDAAPLGDRARPRRRERRDARPDAGRHAPHRRPARRVCATATATWPR